MWSTALCFKPCWKWPPKLVSTHLERGDSLARSKNVGGVHIVQTFQSAGKSTYTVSKRCAATKKHADARLTNKMWLLSTRILKWIPERLPMRHFLDERENCDKSMIASNESWQWHYKRTDICIVSTRIAIAASAKVLILVWNTHSSRTECTPLFLLP